MIAAISNAPVTAIAAPPHHMLPPEYRARIAPAKKSMPRATRLDTRTASIGLVEHHERHYDRERRQDDQQENAERALEVVQAEAGDRLGEGGSLDEAPAEHFEPFGAGSGRETGRQRFRNDALPR